MSSRNLSHVDEDNDNDEGATYTNITNTTTNITTNTTTTTSNHLDFLLTSFKGSEHEAYSVRVFSIILPESPTLIQSSTTTTERGQKRRELGTTSAVSAVSAASTPAATSALSSCSFMKLNSIEENCKNFKLLALQNVELACNVFTFLVYHTSIVLHSYDLPVDQHVLTVVKKNYPSIFKITKMFNDSNSWIRSPTMKAFLTGAQDLHLKDYTAIRHIGINQEQVFNSMRLIARVLFEIDDPYYSDFPLIRSKLTEFVTGYRVIAKKVCKVYDQGSLLSHILVILSNNIIEILQNEEEM